MSDSLFPGIFPSVNASAGSGGSLDAPSGNGIAVHTGSGDATARTLTGTAGQIEVTNGSGVSGNPTLAFAPNSAALTFTSLASGMVVKSDANTAVARTITGINGVTVANGDGVSGNPTITLGTQTEYFEANRIGTSGFTANAATGSFSIGGVVDGTVPVYRRLQFTANQATFTSVVWRPPANWNRGNISITYDWTASAGSAGGTVTWDAVARALSDDDPLNPTLGAYTSVSDDLIAQNDMHTCTTAAFAVEGSPAAGDAVYIQIRRNAAVGSDDLGQHAMLLGFGVNYNLT